MNVSDCIKKSYNKKLYLKVLGINAVFTGIIVLFYYLYYKLLLIFNININKVELMGPISGASISNSNIYLMKLEYFFYFLFFILVSYIFVFLFAIILSVLSENKLNIKKSFKKSLELWYFALIITIIFEIITLIIHLLDGDIIFFLLLPLLGIIFPKPLLNILDIYFLSNTTLKSFLKKVFSTNYFEETSYLIILEIILLPTYTIIMYVFTYLITFILKLGFITSFLFFAIINTIIFSFISIFICCLVHKKYIKS